jgi:hypothetical protein
MSGDITRQSWGRWASEGPLSPSEIAGSGGVPTEAEQEGESPAFRAGKGQVFPICEPRKGHRESSEARG